MLTQQPAERVKQRDHNGLHRLRDFHHRELRLVASRQESRVEKARALAAVLPHRVEDRSQVVLHIARGDAPAREAGFGVSRVPPFVRGARGPCDGLARLREFCLLPEDLIADATGFDSHNFIL